MIGETTSVLRLARMVVSNTWTQPEHNAFR